MEIDDSLEVLIRISDKLEIIISRLNDVVDL